MDDFGCELQPLSVQSDASQASWLRPKVACGRWTRWTLGLAAVLLAAVLLWPREAAAVESVEEVDWDLIESWEDLPGIEDVVREAQELPMQQVTLPNEWNLTECVIDGFQAMTYLGTAVLELYQVARIGGSRCPDDSPAGCAASVAGIFAAISWVGAYISMSANACVAAGDTKANCANDWLTFMASLSEVAVAGAAVSEDCNFEKDWLKLLKITDEEDEPGWKKFVPAAAGPKVETVMKIDKLNRAHEARNFNWAVCAFDVGNSLAYIVREVIQIKQAVQACPDPYNCAISILNVLASFGWIIRFGAVMAVDCTNDENQGVTCASDIAEMFAGLVNLPANGMASTGDCAF
eukprot:s836_g7.t1